MLCLLSAPLTAISQDAPPAATEAVPLLPPADTAPAVPVAEDAAVEETPAEAVPLTDEYGKEIELPSFDKRTVNASIIEKLKADKNMHYRDKPAKEANSKSAERFTAFIAMVLYVLWKFSWVILALLLAGLGYLLYRFMKNNGLSIFRKPKLIDGLEEIQEEDLQSAGEYEEKIRAAIAAGEIRQAIRWWYLYTLFQLANRQLITPGREKTNNDYLRSMRNTPYYKTFSTLTLDYEYIWYGGFDISEDNFRTMDQQFRDFNHQLGKAS